MKRIVFISLCLIFVGCRKDNTSYNNIDCTNKTNEIKKVKKLLTGTYTWTHTYRHLFDGLGNTISRDTLTPTSTGATIKYVFYKNETFDVIDNNQNKRTYKYLIDYGFNVLGNPSDSTTLIEYKDPKYVQQMGFFRPFLCKDSAKFENLYANMIDEEFFKRN